MLGRGKLGEDTRYLRASRVESRESRTASLPYIHLGTLRVLSCPACRVGPGGIRASSLIPAWTSSRQRSTRRLQTSVRSPAVQRCLVAKPLQPWENRRPAALWRAHSGRRYWELGRSGGMSEECVRDGSVACDDGGVTGTQSLRPLASRGTYRGNLVIFAWEAWCNLLFYRHRSYLDC